MLPNLFLVTGLVVAIQCSPPFKPDYDTGYGQLIYTDRCGQEPLYLLNLVQSHAYQSGQAYRDTLTISGVRYSSVIRLDSSQTVFLTKRKLFDKVSIDFRPLTRQPLPICVSVPTVSLQTVQVLSIQSAGY